mmetsp:Transcript_18105/g.59144  ORF Transcript_18105/g.59144 Transcript_18105/m.59144 type:complete len:212 (-) Transcript_18105:1304-1939(-)
MARALGRLPARSSKAAEARHSGTHAGFLRVPREYASRACAMRSAPSDSSSCPSISHIFHDDGKRFKPSSRMARSVWMSPASRSTMALFIHTRAEHAGSDRAFCNSMRARSTSWFSNSSLNAASMMFSESEMAVYASSNVFRAPGTFPASHLSFASISHRCSSCGQYATALDRMVSKDSLVPSVFSSSAALSHTSSSDTKVDSAFSRMERAV